jgi:AcrR family transcriptional regulator
MRSADPPSKAAATQERLLSAATTALVTSDGHLEMQAVARAAGVVPSVASHHFGSRSGLVSAVVDAFFDRLHAEVLDADLRATGSWFEREHERVRRGVRFHMTDPLAPVVYGSLSRDPEVAAVERRRIDEVVAESARNIASAQRAGELPEGVAPELAAAAIFGAARQITLTALSARRRPSQRTVVDLLWRLTVAAVTPTIERTP